MPSRLRFAKRSSTRASLLVAMVALAAVVSLIGLAAGSGWLAFVGLAGAIVGAAGFALHLIVTERRRHEVVEGELESLVRSLGSITGTLDPDEVLARTLREAKKLFGAKASLLAPGETAQGDGVFRLRIHEEDLGAVRLVRCVRSTAKSRPARSSWRTLRRGRSRTRASSRRRRCVRPSAHGSPTS